MPTAPDATAAIRTYLAAHNSLEPHADKVASIELASGTHHLRASDLRDLLTLVEHQTRQIDRIHTLCNQHDETERYGGTPWGDVSVLDVRQALDPQTAAPLATPRCPHCEGIFNMPTMPLLDGTPVLMCATCKRVATSSQWAP